MEGTLLSLRRLCLFISGGALGGGELVKGTAFPSPTPIAAALLSKVAGGGVMIIV